LRDRLLIVLLCAAVAACGNLPRPFQPEYKTTDTFALLPIDKGGLVVQPVQGLPPAAAEAFTQALIESLHKEDVAAMAGPGNAAALVLGGDAVPAGAGWDITLALGDARNTALGSFVAHAAPQKAEDPKAWAVYARTVARSVAGILDADPALRNPDAPVVAIGAVTGITGEDGRALTRALEYTLEKSRIKVAAPADKPTHTVVGAVTIAPPRGPAGKEVRNVDVRWTVLRADNSQVGEVRQTNDVPVAMLDRDWPDIALAVADAATDGIVNLVNRRSTVTR